jgi:magnesium transporter
MSETNVDNPEQLARMLRTRAPLDAAELLAVQPREQVEAVLAALPAEFAARVRAHLPNAVEEVAVPLPGNVSELMEPVPGILPPETTAAGAVDFLVHCKAVDDVTYLYVVDAAGRLIGLVVMRDLLLAKPGQKLSEIMLRNPFSFRPEMELAVAIKAAVARHYPVYPVCDAEGRLVGLVRGWRLFERQAIEIAAQSGRMVGVNKEERVDTGIWESLRTRHPWLQVNLLTAFLAGAVVSAFEGTISQLVALAAFLPILAGQSGNTGCQALAITLRGYTLGDIEDFPLRKHLFKEMSLGAINGFLTGVVAGIAMWLTASGDAGANAALLGVVICVAMTGACMISGMLGVLVPLALKRFGADPATASSIFLTTGTDIAGMGLMLLLATMFIL